ncbi:MAG: aspartate/glutamate racemase family protein [Curvibacter sp.]
MPAQVLIINPNTSASVSRLLHELALQQIGAEVAVRVQTARLGASYISDEVSYAIAGHALLDAYAFDRSQPGQRAPDAVLIGCFGDPGLLALRQLSEAPVLGLAEASMRAAHALGPYAVVTGGRAWVPMLERLAAQLALDDRLMAVQAVEKNGAQLAAQPQEAAQELADLCLQVLAGAPGLQTLLRGGAALGGLAAPVQDLLAQRGAPQVQVLDSVRSSLGALAAAARQHIAQRGALTTAASDRAVGVSGTSSLNLSTELTQLLGQPSAVNWQVLAH